MTRGLNFCLTLTAVVSLTVTRCSHVLGLSLLTYPCESALSYFYLPNVDELHGKLFMRGALPRGILGAIEAFRCLLLCMLNHTQCNSSLLNVSVLPCCYVSSEPGVCVVPSYLPSHEPPLSIRSWLFHISHHISPSDHPSLPLSSSTLLRPPIAAR